MSATAPAKDDANADTVLAPAAPVALAGAEDTLLQGRAHDVEAQTLDGPSGGAPPSSTPVLALLADDERYDIAGEVARGGLGRILAATDKRLRRQVALKELLRDGGDAEARFLREALITARLQHPSIIPLHDAGRFRSGQIFYSMKLVSGRSLEAAIESRPTLAERLSLLPHVIDVADAIAYAHSRRIIHRDLKPLNVLVGEFGETVVIDWGLAKDLSAGHADSDRAGAAVAFDEGSAHLTMDGAIMGTPAYMPPEQARGAGVDERADVYALGAILYHLLAGAPPYDDAPIREILRKLISNPPAPPTPLRRRVAGVPRDLEAIVDKAMAGAPEDRYRSAGDLVADLKKFQTGQIVGAYRYSTRELVLRFLRRNRAAMTLVALLVVGAGVSVTEIVDKGRIAQRGRRLAEEAREKASRAEARERSRADEVTLAQARLSLDHDPEKSLRFLTQLSPSFPHFETARVIAGDAISRALPRTLRGHQGDVAALAVSPDGRLIASGSNDRTVRIWETATGKSRTFEGHTGLVIRLAFSPDGQRLASASYDTTVRLWEVATGQSVVLEGHRDWLSTVAFSPDGKRLVSGGADNTLRLWDLSAGAPRAARTLEGHQVYLTMAAFSPDGGEILSAGNDGTVRAWDTVTGAGRVLHQGEDTGVVSRASADGAFVATGGSEGRITLIETRTRRSRVLEGHDAGVLGMAFSHDGKRLAASGADRTVRLWDVATGKVESVLRGHEKGARTLAFSPDDRRLATGSADTSIRLWDLASGESQVLRAHEGQIMALAFTPDGAALVSSSRDATVRIWRLSADEGRTPGHDGPVSDVVFSPDGKRAFSAGMDTTVRLWDTASRRAEILQGHAAAVRRVVISPDGKLLATGAADGGLRLWDVSGSPARALVALEGHTGPVRDLAFSSDGRRLASASEDGTVRLWDVAARAPERLLAGHGGAVYRLAFSPDGQRLASGGSDKTVRIWDPATGEVRIVSGHGSQILGLAFSPDGHTVASASLDGTVGVWSTVTAERRVFKGSEGGLYDVRFSPRGDVIATSSDSGLIRLWDLATGESRGLHGHEAHVRSLAFSSDGLTLASAGADGDVRLWDVQSGESRGLRGHKDDVLRVVFAPGGRLVATAGSDGGVGFWRDELPHEREALRARLRGLLGAEDTAPSGP
jgi:WD40 repeat protein